MTTLNEAKSTALTAQGFTSGTLGDRELAWLADQTGLVAKKHNDHWMTLLVSLGYTTGSLNDRQMASWLALGYTGNWNERAKQFWEGGGTYGPPSTDSLLLESGDYLLLESGDRLLLE